jgi:peptide methionine sulfoxide reductase MsrA
MIADYSTFHQKSMIVSYHHLVLLIGVVALAPAFAINVKHSGSSCRRKFLTTGSAITLGVICGTILKKDASAETIAPGNRRLQSPNNEFVYIGCGCFWHIQHSVAVYERDVLGRKGGALTCQTGYAGGKGESDPEGRVCYHNPENIADYAKLGHGEVVGVDMPSEMIAELVQLYFSQFDPQTKDRRDPMDRGPEYRNVLGLSGGSHHPLYSSVAKIASKAGFKLQAGKGSDPDTLGKQVVYVYDTHEFPFYQAEIYHQFHNDFQSLPYGSMYNDLANRALEDERLHSAGCPDRV